LHLSFSRALAPRAISKTNSAALFYRFEIPFANFFHQQRCCKDGSALLFCAPRSSFTVFRRRVPVISLRFSPPHGEETALKRLHQMRPGDGEFTFAPTEACSSGRKLVRKLLFSTVRFLSLKSA
jgi:hypothetical protein